MRKILVSLLVVSMLLGLVGTASAAAFSDTAGNKYTDKVAAFGWMGGYPDGTFKPAGNITRAEVAAVLVRALGLEAAADAAKGIGSKFTDVPATHWAAGYVNVCNSKNIIKGYADGTFKPEANVTNAEVITMIIRALNREALAVGDWPVGHITAAVDAGIIGTGFTSSALATRENVATYVAKASTKDFYKLTTAGWEADTTKSFVELCSFTKGTAVTLTSFTSTALTAGGATKDLAANFRVAGGKELKDLIGYQVFLTTNADGDVVLLETDSTYTIKTGTVDYKIGDTALYLKSDTTKYTMDNDYDVYLNGVAGTANVLTNVSGAVELHIADDVVEVIKMKDFQVEDVAVSSIYSSGAASGWTLTAATVQYTVASDAIIEKNGAVVTFADVKKGDVVNIAHNGSTVIKYLEATDKTVAGKVTAKRTVDDGGSSLKYYLTIDGVEYLGVNLAALNGAAVNNSVEVTLTVGGNIFATEVIAAAAKYGKVVSFATGATYDQWVVNVNGVATTYEVAKASDVSLHADILDGKTSGTGTPNAAYPIAVGSYVKLGFDANGRITATFDSTTGLVTAGTVPVSNFVALVTNASYIKVATVYSADKLVKISQIYGDNETTPANNRTTISSTYVTVPDTAIVYTNGSYTGTGIGNITEGSFIQYVLDSTGAKVDLMLVDNTVTYVAGKVSKDADSIDGLAGAVTGGTLAAARAKTYLYSSADFAAAPVAVGTVNADGSFTIGYGTVTAGQACYLKIVEPYGVNTVITFVHP